MIEYSHSVIRISKSFINVLLYYLQDLSLCHFQLLLWLSKCAYIFEILNGWISKWINERILIRTRCGIVLRIWSLCGWCFRKFPWCLCVVETKVAWIGTGEFINKQSISCSDLIVTVAIHILFNFIFNWIYLLNFWYYHDILT